MVLMIKLFNKLRQKGAMFGVDARITLAVTAIAAFIVGFNQFTSLERGHNKTTELDLQIIKNSVLDYYKSKYVMVTDLDTLINEQYLQLPQKYNVDPWGVSYAIKSITQEETVGNSQMMVKYVTLIAHGKDGVQNISTPTNYTQWLNLVESGDDIILKFSTRDIEQEVSEIEESQLSIIQGLVNNYVKQQESAVKAFCNVSGNQLTSTCDVDGNGTYYENEELTQNFMLKDRDDAAAKYYITTNGTHGTENKFKSGYVNTTVNVPYNMYTFMSVIGGYADYVVSPRGLTLHFSSNRYNSVDSPYFSEIWYDNEVTIF
ncbi:MAG TPA: hypothetical protein DCL21_04100 [Alphaproteobacteria bacterium]|nr:hypothetical protein [Alphaproteobacteria bacterium]